MSDNKSGSSRRDFLAFATTATAGLGMALPMASATAATSASGPETDFTRWLDSIPGKHRQVTDWPDLNHGMGLVYTLAYLMTAGVAYGVTNSDVGAVLVIRHNTIPIALNDSVWAKYKLGENFQITDPDTNAPALKNPFYLKPGGLPFTEAALQKLIEAGVKIAACNLALTFRSGMIAKKLGLNPDDVRAEWVDALYPGIQLVPSGVVATNGAMSRGCAYLFAG